MKRLFKVDHGIDNSEELIDLEEIVFVRMNWEHGEPPVCHVTLAFKSGLTEQITLTEKGYEKFVESLKAD